MVKGASGQIRNGCSARSSGRGRLLRRTGEKWRGLLALPGSDRPPIVLSVVATFRNRHESKREMHISLNRGVNHSISGLLEQRSKMLFAGDKRDLGRLAMHGKTFIRYFFRPNRGNSTREYN
jgi:hypothetical protein